MSQAEAEAYLLGFVNYETLSRYRPTTRTHDLDRFKAELLRLGWRPDAIPTVHVGGTNGKGSVSVLLERVLRAGGLKTGLYTSPHLTSMRERIQLDGRPLARAAFQDGVSRLAAIPGRDDGFRTTFEHLTALGFLAFQKADVDVAVIEVGLGGRLDATNILPPGRCVLTPISLDHRQILGRTIGQIAADKAHILKRGGQAFLMPQRAVAREILLERCRRESLTPSWTSDHVRVDMRANSRGSEFHIHGCRDYGPIRTRLLGAHQAGNLAAVVAVAETFFSGAALSSAIENGLKDARVPGRLDLREASPGRVLLDGGHNPAAARAVARALGEHFPGARVHAVVGMARDKDIRGYLNALAPCISAFHFTTTGSPRAASPEILKERSRRGGSVHPTPGAAFERAAKGSPDLILIAGSFVLVGEIMRQLDLSR
jgi:dihydrofolate synthase / folylpolyglutamate synthase